MSNIVKNTINIGSSDVSLGESSELPTFTVVASAIAIGNNKSMVSIQNTTGSVVKVRLVGIKIKNAQTTAVTGVMASFNLLRATAHTAGALLTPVSHDTTDTLSSSVSARTGATISGEIATVIQNWKWSTDEFGTGTLDQEGYDHALQELNYAYSQLNGTKPLTINANEVLHIKQVVNSTIGIFDLQLTFTIQ